MSATTPIRVDEELYAAAKIVAPLMSRSAAQQIAHWARIGRELESADSVSQRRIAGVLTGRRDYDELGAEEQAVVRAEWSARMDARREALDLAAEFTEAGQAYVEVDGEGRLVHRDPAAGTA